MKKPAAITTTAFLHINITEPHYYATHQAHFCWIIEPSTNNYRTVSLSFTRYTISIQL